MPDLPAASERPPEENTAADDEASPAVASFLAEWGMTDDEADELERRLDEDEEPLW